MSKAGSFLLERRIIGVDDDCARAATRRKTEKEDEVAGSSRIEDGMLGLGLGPEATLPNANAGGGQYLSTNEVSDSSPRVVGITPIKGVVPRHRTVVLPKLQIPTFSGPLRDWQSFWDHFSATIHLNEEFLQIEKFKYLLTYLTGAAKTAIKGIRLTEDNYGITIKTLAERFGRHDSLINEHVDRLLALAPVKLRLLYDKVQFRVSALTGLGVSPDQYNVLLNHVLIKCLPDDLAIVYRQKAKEAPQDTSVVQPSCISPYKREDSGSGRATHRCTIHQNAASDICPSALSGLNARKPAHIYSRRCLKGPQVPGYWKRGAFLGYVRPLEASQIMRSRRVALTLRGQRRDIAVTVEALEAPEVCTVTIPPISSTVLERLCGNNYDVADDFYADAWHSQEISVLLGSDVYWKVATGRIDCLTSDLTAVETKFGCTVQGTMELAGSSTPYERSIPEMQHDFPYSLVVIDSGPPFFLDSSPDELQPLTPSHLLGRCLRCLLQEASISHGTSSTREYLLRRARYHIRTTGLLMNYLGYAKVTWGLCMTTAHVRYY
ncbi:hypothetical protein HPB52_003797 [Rhipicephalus sanguineus]|uniref:Uncharacterized protein n=1 Tax=Rhipicephalus sanguineus TaxID=34632 RepID=A0A9D4T1C4_RHISA|nr:hypothetical protein HPB52_003797 [Rhipicephalus sanguineus]